MSRKTNQLKNIYCVVFPARKKRHADIANIEGLKSEWVASREKFKIRKRFGIVKKKRRKI